jgi:large-conductance mechanosensitive channel
MELLCQVEVAVAVVMAQAVAVVLKQLVEVLVMALVVFQMQLVLGV